MRSLFRTLKNYQELMKLIYQLGPCLFLKILQETLFSLLSAQYEYKKGPYQNIAKFSRKMTMSFTRYFIFLKIFYKVGKKNKISHIKRFVLFHSARRNMWHPLYNHIFWNNMWLLFGFSSFRSKMLFKLLPLVFFFIFVFPVLYWNEVWENIIKRILVVKLR